MKKQTRIIKIIAAFALVCAMVLSLASCSSGANADSANGTHGALTWTYEKDTKTLTVSGTGPIADFASADEIVWKSVLTSAEKLVVSDGITSIGSYAFYYMPKLTTLTLPATTLTSIGKYAFAYNTVLSSVTIPATVTSIGEGAFEGCSALTSVYLPASVTSIGQRAFAYCYSMTGVVFTGETVSVGAEAFKNCRSMSTLIVRDTVSADMIDATAFAGAAVSFDNATRTDNPTGSTTVTVRYMQDGAELTDAQKVLIYSYGETYSIATPTKEGYTADILTVVGTADGKAHEYTVTYTANVTDEDASAETEPVAEENGEDEKITPTAIIAIVVMVVVLIAIAVGAFLLMRSDKKPAKKNAPASKGTKKK